MVGQCLDCFVLAYDSLLRHRNVLHALAPDGHEVYCVLSVVAQDVHREKVVGENQNIARGLVALRIFVFLLNKNATTLAISVATGCFRAKHFLDFLVHRNAGQLHHALNGCHRHVAAKDQRVCNLSPMLTAGADTGVLRVHLGAGVGAFDLGQLGAHAVFAVGVHVADPLRCTLAIHTDLRPRQNTAPQRFHAVLLSVLNVVCDLATACACTGLDHNVLEAGDAVLKQLDLRCARCGWSSTGELNHVVGLFGGNFVLRTNEVLLHYRTDVGQLKHSTFAYKAYVGLLTHTLLILDTLVDGVRNPQDSGCVGGNCGVDVQFVLVAHALERFGHRLPLVDIYGFRQRPVCVHTAARRHHPWVAQCGQPRSFGEIHDGLCCGLG